MPAVETLEKPAPLVKVATVRRAPRRVRWVHFLAVGVIAVLSAVALEAAWVLVGPNYHTVLPGEIYRSGQLDRLETMAVVRRDGIRTVINLRGCCEDADWYHEEVGIHTELGVKQCDIVLSSYSLPSVPEFQKLIQALEECEYPILLHCRRGADRTGLAAGIALLLRSDAELPTGRRQLTWRYGHFGLIGVAELESVWDMYAEWLAERGETHRPELLRRWGMEGYRPAHCWAEIEPLDVPTRVKCGRREGARFRVTNRSAYPWRFAKELNAGVSLYGCLAKPDALKGREFGAGFFDATLAPGESIELTLALPAIRDPGRYRLVVDMYDCRMTWFHSYGSPRFERELEVVVD